MHKTLVVVVKERKQPLGLMLILQRQVFSGCGSYIRDNVVNKELKNFLIKM